MLTLSQLFVHDHLIIIGDSVVLFSFPFSYLPLCRFYFVPVCCSVYVRQNDP